MECIHRLNEAWLPTGAVLLPAEEQCLSTVRCSSYEWKMLSVHVEDVRRTVVRIVSPDGTHHVARPIEHVSRAGQAVLPRGGCASDLRAHRGPQWRASRPATNDARLPTRRPASSKCINRACDRKKHGPERSRSHHHPRAHVTRPTPSCARRKRDVSPRADIVYRKRTTDRTRRCLTPLAWVHASYDAEKHYPCPPGRAPRSSSRVTGSRVSPHARPLLIPPGLR
jgi:hypothetical protein